MNKQLIALEYFDQIMSIIKQQMQETETTDYYFSVCYDKDSKIIGILFLGEDSEAIFQDIVNFLSHQ